VSHARACSASSIARDHAPVKRMISTRCTKQAPRNGTSSGCGSHQSDKAETRGQHEQQAALRTIVLPTIEKVQTSGEPAGSSSNLPTGEQIEDQPERATRRLCNVPVAKTLALGANPQRLARIVLSNEIGRRREQFEVGGGERRRFVGRR